MYTVRRWWERKGLHIGLLTLVIVGVWALRQTQGGLLLELYQGMTRQLQELQGGSNREELFEDAKFKELETKIVDLESQNQKLKALVSYVEKEKLSSDPIIARVMLRSADNWWQQVTLNRGSNAGIEKGFIVKAEGGLVGAIQSVTANTSRVLLISDLKSQVGVTVSRTSAKGVLRGDGSSEAVLEFYEKVPDVKPGDLISTSTYSQKFPSGLAIGQIKSLDLKKLPASEAKVELFPPMRSLDWVMVYPMTDNQQPQKSQ